MYIYYNPNPNRIDADDCLIRAISLITNRSWDDIYVHLCIEGFIMKNMPSTWRVWSTFLTSIGFDRYPVLDRCPDCYTVRDFCFDNPIGEFILATGSHVIAVISGDYYDSWDSGDELPIAVWRRDQHA